MGAFSAEEGRATVARMNQTIVHRGPDDEGAWSGDGVAFGMRRLSIIDLPGGHQPMWTEDGVGIVFNGEIYNYLELRSELLDSGYQLRTHSDTEVILNLYHRDGLAAIDRLEGMFAICLYDPNCKRMHLIRDRVGIKPLYYGAIGGAFFFASEIKAILAAMDNRPSLNMQSLHHYLTLRFIPSPDTIWLGISKLPPGHILTMNLEDHSWEARQYWQLRFDSHDVEAGRDYFAEFEHLFLSVVEKRLLASDVPVGVLLSGGLDSSAISAAAVELGHRDFHTFSVAFDDGGLYDETPYAREVAARIGSNHHEVRVGKKDFIDFLPDFVRYSDEPLADLASIPLYYVCRLACKDVKVVLSGEGGDEVLAGYNMDRIAGLLERLKWLEHWMSSLMIAGVGKLIPGRYGSALKYLAKAGWQGFLSSQAYHMTNYWNEEDKSTLWKERNKFASTAVLIRSWYEKAALAHPIDQLQQVYCHEWLVEDLLMKADKMSMANSLELRVPFLDHALVDWASKLPLEWKVGNRSVGMASKRILRAFASKRLPHSIRERPKQGFPVPAYQWLKENNIALWADTIIRGPDSCLGGYFNTGQMRHIVQRATHGDITAAHKVWLLIILEYWMREWL